jgi:hypothetical protein
MVQQCNYTGTLRVLLGRLASKLAPVTTTVPKVGSIPDYMDYGDDQYRRPRDIPDIRLDS